MGIFYIVIKVDISDKTGKKIKILKKNVIILNTEN